MGLSPAGGRQGARAAWQRAHGGAPVMGSEQAAPNRAPHYEPHTAGSTSVPGAGTTCKLGSS